MSWRDHSPEAQTFMRQTLTAKQLDAWKLSLDGAGYDRISLALDISPSSARDRIKAARRKLAAAYRPQENA